MKNSAGETYVFSEKETSTLLAYIPGGILQPGTFFAFGDNVTNSIDSRKMGGLGMKNFVGKVILPQN